MRFLKKAIRNWLYSDENNKVVGLSARDFPLETSVDDEPALNFRIYNAQNGKILEFNKYDRKTDKNNKTIYIVEKDKEVIEYVGKCLSLELLR